MDLLALDIDSVVLVADMARKKKNCVKIDYGLLLKKFRLKLFT